MRSSPSYQGRDKDVHPQRCPPHFCSALYWRFCSGQLGNEEHARARTQVHTQVRRSTWTRMHAVEARRTHWAGRRLVPADHGDCGPCRVGSGSTGGTVSQRRPERQPGAVVAPSLAWASFAFGNLERVVGAGAPKIPLFQPLTSAVAELGGVISPPRDQCGFPAQRDAAAAGGGRGRAGRKSQPGGLQRAGQASATGEPLATWPWPT